MYLNMEEEKGRLNDTKSLVNLIAYRDTESPEKGWKFVSSKFILDVLLVGLILVELKEGYRFLET